MENSLTIPQPITLAGCSLLFMACPLIAGWLHAHWRKAAACWIVVLVLAVGCVIVGEALTQDGVAWVVNPVPLFCRYVGVAGPVTMLFFGIGVAARRRAALLQGRMRKVQIIGSIN